MSLTRRVINGLFWGQIGMSARTILCFLISMIVARSLGAENFGVYAAFISLVDMLVKLSEMGVQSLFSTYIPRYQSLGQGGQCSFVLRRILLLRFVLALIIVIVLFCYSETLMDALGIPELDHYLLLIGVWFLTQSMMDSFLFIVIANMRMKWYSLVELLVSVFQLASVLILTQRGMSIEALVSLIVVVRAIQLSCYLYHSFPTLSAKPVAVDLRPIAKFSLILWLSSVLQYFRFKSIDVFMILYFLKDTAEVAYYEIAYMLTLTGGYVLLTSLDPLLQPIYSEAHSRDGVNGLRKAWSFSTKLSIFLGVPILVFMIAHSESIVRCFYTETYLQVAPLIVVFSLFSILSICCSSETSITVVFPLNKERLFLYVRGVNGIVNIILNIVLIPKYGVLGAVLATGGTTLLTTLYEYRLAVKLVGIRLPYAFIVKLLLVIFISISWTLLFDDMNLWELLVVGSIYYGFTLFIMLHFYHFTEREKEIFNENFPKVYCYFINKILVR